MILTEKDEEVPKGEDEVERKKVSKKKLQRQKMKEAVSGGGE